jgi:hypothetical protein
MAYLLYPPKKFSSSFIRLGRLASNCASTRNQTSSSNNPLGWINASGLSVKDRLTLEENLLQQQQQQQQRNDDHGHRLPSLVLVVGHSHKQPLSWQRQHDDSSSSTFVVQPSSLWTTFLSTTTTTTTTSNKQTKEESHYDTINNISTSNEFYQAFFQGLWKMQQNQVLQQQQQQQQQQQVCPPPPPPAPRVTKKKTLIMESKACCGIGTTGKILSLEEIQTKQAESRPKRRFQQEQQQETLLLYYHEHDQTWYWQGQQQQQQQAVHTSTDNTSLQNFALQRTAWHWQSYDDNNELSVGLSDLFPTLTLEDTMHILERVATEKYDLENLSLQEWTSKVEEPQEQEHVSAF